ncbi:ATP-binding cassette domain-containing protein [Spiroplasma taiwanense]|uniref:ATP-binding cassette domain-containing protein n=1 Tax=Spiroplasma taiwanense TaxID=2145 RepID=UPI000A06D5D6|nr:ATP-binding cassette domain-containing protein [Spiroplasma taiwanense]
MEVINDISLKNIDISIADRKIIKDFNYNFLKNKKYLITGTSGSGKSTLLKAIVGIVDIENGNLIANNIEINQNNFLSFRDKIDYIDQNIYLFKQSIAYNMYNQKQILILDELTANLDSIKKNDIEKLVLSQKGKTAIMVSPNFTEEN